MLAHLAWLDMRSLIVSCNLTVDGFMSGAGDTLASLEFITPDRQQEDELAARFRSTADTWVVGRQTFLDMHAFWSTAEGDMADWLNKTPKVVLSNDPGFDVSIWENSTLLAGDGVAQVRRLKESSGKALVSFGGVRALRSLVGAGLVDEYWLKISPTVVGRGGSMFADLAERRPLTLRDVMPYPSGLVDVTYSATA